jgi:hypothetical protein
MKLPRVPPPALPPKPLRTRPETRTVQAKAAPRLYPNLNPRAAAVKARREEIVTLSPFFEDYRITRPDFRGQMLPNTRYVFVTDQQGAIRMHPRYRHPVIADGKPVRYAGEADFQHGELRWWSNASGNYKPDRRHAEQAGLPLDRFFTHEEVRSGAHRRGRK